MLLFANVKWGGGASVVGLSTTLLCIVFMPMATLAKGTLVLYGHRCALGKSQARKMSHAFPDYHRLLAAWALFCLMI